jgi:hypothetical protein
MSLVRVRPGEPIFSASYPLASRGPGVACHHSVPLGLDFGPNARLYGRRVAEPGQAPAPDLSALLFEIADAWRAMDEFARRAFPDAK